jgi:hypothetical protein
MKKNTIYTLIFISTAFFSDLLSAETRSTDDLLKQSSNILDRCIDKTGGYGFSGSLCVIEGLHRDSVIYQNLYSSVKKKITAPQQKRLFASTHAWLKTIDRKCFTKEFRRERMMGWGQKEDYHFCLIIEYGERIDWLKKHYRRLAY